MAVIGGEGYTEAQMRRAARGWRIGPWIQVWRVPFWVMRLGPVVIEDAGTGYGPWVRFTSAGLRLRACGRSMWILRQDRRYFDTLDRLTAEHLAGATGHLRAELEHGRSWFLRRYGTTWA